MALAFAMCVGSLPVTAFAADGEESSGVDTISISSGGEISVNGKAAAEPVSASVEPSASENSSEGAAPAADTKESAEPGKENNTDTKETEKQESTEEPATEPTEKEAAADKTENLADNAAGANKAPAKAPVVGNPEQEKPAEPEPTETQPTVDTVKPSGEVEIVVTPENPTKTETVKPDGVPDGVKPDEKGNYTWTEVTKPGDEDKTTKDVPVPTDEELKTWEKGDTKTEKGTDKDGKPVTTVIETYTKTDANGVVTTYTKKTVTHSTGVEGEEVDTEKTETQTTTTQTTTTVTDPTTTTTTVAPAKVTVTMEKADTDKKDLDIDVTGATVLVKNDGNGGYDANIKLNLSGIKTDKGDVTLTVECPDGTKLTATINKDSFDTNGNVTLDGIKVNGLVSGESKEVKLTLTGEQVEKVVTSTEKAQKAQEKAEKHFWNFGENGMEKDTLSKDEQQLIENFLGALEVTEDFVIYADVYDAKTRNNTGYHIDHIDGNICVNEMNDKTVIQIPDSGHVQADDPKEKQETTAAYVKNGYSYIGKTTGSGEITRVTNNAKDSEGKGIPATVVVGEDVEVKGKNNDSVIVELNKDMFDENGKLTEDAVNAMTAEHPELANIAKETQIKANLEEIVKTGQALAQKLENNTIDADKEKILAVRDLLEQETLTKDDVVSITIGVDMLTSTKNQNEFDSGNNGQKGDYLSQLINANKGGATIIINVDMGEEPPEEVTINKKMTGTKEYDGKAAHLIWNFGKYDGVITFGTQYERPENVTFGGKVVAANADLQMGYLQSGSVVGKKVTHANELHMAMPSPTPPTPIEPDDEPKVNTTEKVITLVITPEDGQKITSTSGGNSSTKIELESTDEIFMKEPDQPTPPTPPDNPDNPPDNPDNPDNPPDTPDNPPDNPDNPPDEPDIPDEDVPKSDEPDVEIPDEPVPQSDTPEIDIPDGDVPLANFPPDDAEIDIPDEDVPLSDVPRTGDDSGMWDGLAALSVCGLIVLTRAGKRKVEK